MSAGLGDSWAEVVELGDVEGGDPIWESTTIWRISNGGLLSDIIAKLHRRIRFDELGAQSNPGVVSVSRAYRCVRNSSVPLQGLTEQRLDYPGNQNLGVHQVFDEVPEPDLH